MAASDKFLEDRRMLVRKMVLLVAVCMISSLSVAADAQAQNAQTRQGFWFSGGLGYGSLGCAEGCDQREGSVSADISLGGMARRKA